MAESNRNPKNVQIEIEYYEDITIYNKKYNKTTAKSKLRAVTDYAEYFNDEDYILYDKEHGAKYYAYLGKKDIEPSTKIARLRSLIEFFEWYLSRARKAKKQQVLDIKVLEPNNTDIKLSNRPKFVEFPTDEEVKKIMDLPVNNIIEQRNRAIVAFILITGARISAVATAPLKLIDTQKLIYYQDPLEGIKTKKAKFITTKFMVWNKTYLDYVLDWISTIREEYRKHNCTNEALMPLFPKINDYAKGIEVELKVYGDGSQYDKLFKEICKKANVKYYSPHDFRHYIIFKGLDKVHTGKELKALSQNVGHSDVETALEQYGNMLPHIYSDIIKNMFENKKPQLNAFSTEELLAELQARFKSDKF